MIDRRIVFAVVLFFFTGCNLITKKAEEGTLARVNDVVLTEADIAELLESMIGRKDSATIVSNYINNWVQQELLLQKAELNLREDQKNFQKLLEDYRKSLIIFAYQKEWISQNLDTSVSDAEITSYYENNQANFELKENIVKIRYVIVPGNAPRLVDLEKDIKATDKEGKEAFHEYCLQYAIEYRDNDSTWITFEEVLRTIPLSIDNKEQFLRGNKFVSGTDSVNIYMMCIEDFVIRNNTSPLEFEKEKIKNIIVNQRKLTLMSEMKQDLYETALQKGQAEIYQ